MKRWYPLNNIPVRNPNQSWYRAGKHAFAVTIRDAIILTRADPFFTKERGGPGRSAITSKGKLCGVYETILNRFQKKLLMIEMEEKAWEGFIGCR